MPAATGPGATRPAATELEATGPGATGPGATGPAATGPGAPGPGATGPEAVEEVRQRRPAADLDRIAVASREELRHWLSANHGRRRSIWLVTWRKAVADKHVGYDAIVEEALCFGWIDSLPRALDAERTMLRLSPRRPGSAWSRVNKERIRRLIAAGLMHPAGRAAVDAAEADGSWSRLDAVETLQSPPDLAAALRDAPAADAAFAEFPPSVKRGILEWIASAKGADTRARRIERTVDEAALDLRANHPRQPKGTRAAQRRSAARATGDTPT